MDITKCGHQARSRSWLKSMLTGTLLFGVLTPPTWSSDQALSNEDILSLVRTRFSVPVIVTTIESSVTAFDVADEALVALTANGVPDEVRAAMLQSTLGRAGGRAAWVPLEPPRETFRDALRSGSSGPEMILIPAGQFRMGCLSNDNDCWDNEQPAHDVVLRQQFAMSVRHVTFEDYDRFTFPHRVDDGGWGRGSRPVFNVSWNDAVGYTSWLSDQTGAEYRLPTEAEWEYAARAGSETRFFWGDEVGPYVACIRGECFGHWEDIMPFNVFRANGFGLREMVGYGPQWVQDCWNGTTEAPRQTALHGNGATAACGSCAAPVGATIRGGCGPRFAGERRLPVAPSRDSGWSGTPVPKAPRCNAAPFPTTFRSRGWCCRRRRTRVRSSVECTNRPTVRGFSSSCCPATRTCRRETRARTGLRRPRALLGRLDLHTVILP